MGRSFQGTYSSLRRPHMALSSCALEKNALPAGLEMLKGL